LKKSIKVVFKIRKEFGRKANLNFYLFTTRKGEYQI